MFLLCVMLPLADLASHRLPMIVAAPAVQAGRLRPLSTDWLPPAVPVHAVFASARYLTPKVRGFIDLAVDAMQHSTYQ